MIPSHGRVYSYGLLASVTTTQHRQTVQAWVQAARDLGSYLAAANDLTARADEMLYSGLALHAEEGICTSHQLRAVLQLDYKAANFELARLLLLSDPPPWLSVAVNGGTVSREYIPDLDLAALTWLEPHLDRLLCEVHGENEAAESDSFKGKFGLAAENLVMAALRNSGSLPIHVATISNAFGYDIEVRGKVLDRIEVKAASPRSSGQFHLSRNEFDKCIEHGDEWRLLQVVFTDAAFVSPQLRASHIDGIFELSSCAVRDLIPPDTDEFHWEESAVVAPPTAHWQPWSERPDADVTVPGFI